jgi:proton-dependent oligopeptide transporter, POT family
MSGGQSTDENATNVDKLTQYTDGYQMIGIISIGAGVVLILLSPLFKKLMKTAN